MKKTAPTHFRPVRILVADDHPVVREGLTVLINRSTDMKVVCEALDGRDAIQQFFRHLPDIVLLDFYMPKMTGTEVIRAILEQAPQAKVIVLSTYNRDEDVYQALKAGAKAYLIKDSPREELLDSIGSVHQGNIKMSPKVAARLAAEFARERLTKRETEIIVLMTAGKSNKEIGAQLNAAEGTVKVHVGHILKKLDATGRTDAIRIALERGIVQLRSA